MSFTNQYLTDSQTENKSGAHTSSDLPVTVRLFMRICVKSVPPPSAETTNKTVVQNNQISEIRSQQKCTKVFIRFLQCEMMGRILVCGAALVQCARLSYRISYI